MSKIKISILDSNEEKGFNAQMIDKSIDALEFETDLFKDKKDAFIVVDLSFPYGYPSTFNPDILYNLINLLRKNGIETIKIGGISPFSISSKYIWVSMGFNNYFDDEDIEFIAIEDETEDLKSIKISKYMISVPNSIITSDLLIYFVNPKLDPIFGMNLGVYHSIFCINKIKKTNLDNEKRDLLEDELSFQNKSSLLSNFKSNFNNIYELYFFLKPKLCLYDLSSIPDTAGPLLYAESRLLNFKKVILSNNILITDSILLKLFMETDDLSNCEILFTDKDNLNKNEIDKILYVKIVEDRIKLNYQLIDVEKEKLIENLEEIFNLNRKLKVKKIQEINPRLFNIYQGKTSPALDYSFYIFLSLFNSLLIKDQELIMEFIFLLGNEPEIPFLRDQKIPIIIFGDDAIYSTEEYPFRIIDKGKPIQTEEEFNAMLVKEQAEIREKILEQENINSDIEKNLKQEIKDEKLQEKAIESLKQKFEEFSQKMEENYQKYVLKETTKRNKNMEKSKDKKLALNKNLIEIPGNPPVGLEFLGKIVQFLGWKNLPTVKLFNNIIDTYYDREKYEYLFDQYSKERNNILKEKLMGDKE